MPSRKKSSKKGSQDFNADLDLPESATAKPSGRRLSFITPPLILVALFIVVGLLLYYTDYKNMFVVAQVEGVYIYRQDLNKELAGKYGSAALDDLITVKLIESELEKNKVQVPNDQLEARIAEIEKGLPGVTLQDALTAQGMTMETFRKRVYLNVGLENLVKEKVSVTDEEIDKYVLDYGTSLTATDDNGKREEARKALSDQKIQEEIGKYVNDLRTKAAVTRYI